MYRSNGLFGVKENTENKTCIIYVKRISSFTKNNANFPNLVATGNIPKMLGKHCYFVARFGPGTFQK